MFVESMKLITSVYPFIKEAFLWRDGAEVGKPITKENLIRRKIAVFVLIGSLITNYLVVNKLMEYYAKNQQLSKEVASANVQLALASASASSCAQEKSHMVPVQNVFELVEKQIDEEIHQGLLVRPTKPNKPRR